MKNPNEDWNQEVIIKLKKWQIPRLIGACYLGTLAEDWCASLIQCNINSFDTHSWKWVEAVEVTLDEIKSQTGVSKSDVEYGIDDALNLISKWVARESKKYLNAFWKWEVAGYPEGGIK